MMPSQCLLAGHWLAGRAGDVFCRWAPSPIREFRPEERQVVPWLLVGSWAASQAFEPAARVGKARDRRTGSILESVCRAELAFAFRKAFQSPPAR